MDKPQNKCFIYHKNGIIQDVDDGIFCKNISENKVEILKNLKNQEPNSIIYKNVRPRFHMIHRWGYGYALQCSSFKMPDTNFADAFKTMELVNRIYRSQI